VYWEHTLASQSVPFYAQILQSLETYPFELLVVTAPFAGTFVLVMCTGYLAGPERGVNSVMGRAWGIAMNTRGKNNRSQTAGATGPRLYPLCFFRNCGDETATSFLEAVPVT